MTITRLEAGDLDLATGRVAKSEVRLSRTELAVVRWLDARDEPASVEQLLTEVWGYRPGIKSRTVYSTIDRIRKKLERDPKTPRHLITVEGGYRWTALPKVEMPEGTHGRNGEFDALLGALREHPLVGIYGPGGIGKTHLAEVVFRLPLPRFRERLWVSLAGVTTLEGALASLRLGLELRSEDPETLSAALAGRAPLLVVLDDLDDLGDLGPQMISAVGPSVNRVVLTTSRRRPETGEPLQLGPLSLSSSLALLQPEGDAADAGLVRLAEHLEGLPLALCLAAPWVQRIGAESVLDHSHDLSGLEETFARSWARLDPAQRDALRSLAAVGGNASMSLAARLHEDRPLAMWEGLAQLSLVRFFEGRVQIFHTLRTFILAEGADPGPPRTVALDWALRIAERARDALYGPEQADQLARLRSELEPVRAAIDAGPRGVDWERAVLAAVEPVLHIGALPELDRWLDELQRDPTSAEARVAGCIEQSRLALRRSADAAVPLAAVAFAQDTPLKAQFHLQRALVRMAVSEVPGAREDLERVLSLVPDNRAVRRRAVYQLARLHRHSSEWDAVLERLEELDRLAHLAGDRYHQSMGLSMRSIHARHEGRAMDAEVLTRRARERAAEAGDRELVANLDQTLGAMLHSVDQPAEAMRCYRQAQRFYERHGMVASEGFIRLGMAGVAINAGDDREAFELLLRAEDAFTRSQFARGVAATRGMRARLLTATDEQSRALQEYERVRRALGEAVSPTADDTIFALSAICSAQLGDLAVMVRVRQLPDGPPFGLLKSLIERSATGDPKERKSVRDLVRSTELDRAGIGI